MAKQLHRKFPDKQVKSLLEKYLSKEIKIDYILEVLGIGRSRFFELLTKYREDPKHFSIAYRRKNNPRTIGKEIEENILKELRIEKSLIKNKDMPIKSYNYSYIRDQLWSKYQQKVSLPTIIDRAKKNNFYFPRPKRKSHDREVLTNYAGELIQHDSSQHKRSPYVDEKWHLITSLDDYSRNLLYAEFVKQETSWDHIEALENVILRYGLPYAYYVDSHSIFRFVQGRDSFWRKHHKITDEVDPQWKQVLNECRVKITYALSPQARGKVERPYGWLQDRIVRTCARETIRTIDQARELLKAEVNRYNNHQVHSTTGEIPSLRLQRALDEKKSLFREFAVPPPFESSKDIFSLKAERIVNPYRKISFNNMEFRISGVPIRETVQLRIIPNKESGMAEIRFWCNNKLVDIQKIKNEDLNLVHF
ncbi:MAG: hypothetical protein ACETWK_03690 [Candidatus Aminicenantaceae bacterium]